MNIFLDFLKGNISLFTTKTYERIIAVLIILLCIIFLYNLLYVTNMREGFAPGESAASIALDSLKLGKMNEGKIEMIDERLTKIEKESQEAKAKSAAIQAQMDLEEEPDEEMDLEGTNDLEGTTDLKSLL